MNNLRLIIRLTAGGVMSLVATNEERPRLQQKLVDIMLNDQVLVLTGPNGPNGAVKGNAIAGFGFEEYDPNRDAVTIDLLNRRMVAEVEHLELSVQNLKNVSSGDEWKQ